MDSSLQKVKELVFGKAKNPHDPNLFHKLSLIAFFAWVGLGADGLTSSCYGPEEAFRVLHSHIYLSIFVALASALTIFIISSSYRQIIELFPNGGGGYVVASKLLSPSVGMISGCALIIDYVLTISVSVASGTDALFSFLPHTWLAYKLNFSLVIILILILMNMRGVKETVLTLVPIFLFFILTHIFVIIYAIVMHWGNIPTVAHATVKDIASTSSELGIFGLILLVMRSYSMGAGTFTGIEAVSNGLSILREPRVATGKKTMTYMSISLALMVLGLMIGYLLLNTVPEQGRTLNAVLFSKITTTWKAPFGNIFVFVTLLSEAILLFVAAQTGFLDGPRVISNMALDKWFLSRFAMLSDRFVIQNGILIMGIAAGVTLLVAHGSVQILVVLYSINVFITFFLSQLGMVRHWKNAGKEIEHKMKKMSINLIGLLLTAIILFSVIILKFNEGGWATLLVTGLLIGICLFIKNYYKYTFSLLKRLDSLIVAAETEIEHSCEDNKKTKIDHKAPTAVILVNGYNGLGLHTLFNVIKTFKNIYKNFIFAEVGSIDTGNFKGNAELKNLESRIKHDLSKYVHFMKKQGYASEMYYSIGVDVVSEVSKLAPEILKKYPNVVFFGGQLVFNKESIFSQWLHNFTSFAIQKELYREGHLLVIMPIRINT